MLEITGDDIANLSDGDLRTLVGKLSESELKLQNISTAAVTWGGNQDAADGGIDVRVMIREGQIPAGFVPRASVGYQVKTTDFTPSLIGPEMRPLGHLRDSIKSLIAEGGAYIIVSSGSNTSDSALTDRLNAMQRALVDHKGHENLHFDFYDRSRLATWTRNHPGLVAWVRRQIGRAIPGWQSYSSWAASPDGVLDEYLLDDKSKLRAGIHDGEGMNVERGIALLRSILRQPRKVVRLAGLSGVGKTRLVQTLFDERVGSDSLPPTLAIYTDMQDNPSPQPIGMISDLIASRTRAIVVVDNCAPDLHRRIAEICKSSESHISAITVEYDVRDDEPEGTEVFRLEPASIDLISILVGKRYTTMAGLDAERIADFSGGNARVALALASRLEDGESVAGLRDEELFARLFHQRHTRDDSLLKAAQTCALLYSFQGEALDGDDAELPRIATLAGMDAIHLFAKVSELKQRDLVQSRSVWRAVLPHAIANRLAAAALREIPPELIEQQFSTRRLLTSFSRRLGYLHESNEARRIAEKWLGDNGLLANVERLNDLGFRIFQNIAPVSPEATLNAIERTVSGGSAEGLLNDMSRRDTVISILHLIAYDACMFDRSVGTIIALFLAEDSKDDRRVNRDPIKTLFHLSLSGTHATLQQRCRVVEGLLHSPNEKARLLGLELLSGLLEADGYTSLHLEDFGARVRDHGFSPASFDEAVQWFVETLRLAARFVTSDYQEVSAIQSIVAQAIWSLWFLGEKVQSEFEKIAMKISLNSYWEEGWIAVRYRLSHLNDEEQRNTTSLDRLRDLEMTLRPKNNAERIRAIVLSDNRRSIDFADTEDAKTTEAARSAHDSANVAAEELGSEVCGDISLLSQLLPELVGSCGRRLFPFGRGMARASTAHVSLWEQLTGSFIDTQESQRNATVLCGFLSGLSEIDPLLCESLLEAAVMHPTLGAWFPILQHSVTRTLAGKERLIQSVNIGLASPAHYHFLAWEPLSDVMSAHDLTTILLAVAKQKKGYRSAIDILASQLHTAERESKQPAPELIAAGRALLSDPDFSDTDDHFDHDLRTVANACLRGDEAAPTAQMLCEHVIDEFSHRAIRAYDLEDLLRSIFENQPRIALNAFFGGDTAGNLTCLTEVGFHHFAHRRIHPVDRIPATTLLEWCDEYPGERYPIIANIISFDASGERGATWTPLAAEMLKRAPDALTILNTFVKRFTPRGWSGSLAAIWESRLSLLDQLFESNGSPLVDHIPKIRSQLVEQIAERRKDEEERDRYYDDRFE
jgi:hypothetical protein